MLRAYNYCYYGNKGREFFETALNLVFSPVYAGSVPYKDAKEDIYLPIETISHHSGELYDTYKVTVPISAQVCQRKTIRQVLVCVHRTTYVRELAMRTDNVFVDNLVKVGKLFHELMGYRGVAGVNYKTRQGLGFTVDLPMIGWRKRYATLEKPYAADKVVIGLLQDINENLYSDCPGDDDYTGKLDVLYPFAWYKRDFVVSDFSKEMFSFIQDNDYWQFIIRVNKKRLQKAKNTLVQKYNIPTANSTLASLMQEVERDIFAPITYSYSRLGEVPEAADMVFVSVASLVVNILVEE